MHIPWFCPLFHHSSLVCLNRLHRMMYFLSARDDDLLCALTVVFASCRSLSIFFIYFYLGCAGLLFGLFFLPFLFCVSLVSFKKGSSLPHVLALPSADCGKASQMRSRKRLARFSAERRTFAIMDAEVRILLLVVCFQNLLLHFEHYTGRLFYRWVSRIQGSCQED